MCDDEIRKYTILYAIYAFKAKYYLINLDPSISVECILYSFYSDLRERFQDIDKDVNDK